MAGITGQGTTYNLPNYVGDLFAASPTQSFLKIRPWTLTFVRDGDKGMRLDILDGGEVFSGAWDILAASTRSFTRRATGQVVQATHVNELQQAIEELSV